MIDDMLSEHAVPIVTSVAKIIMALDAVPSNFNKEMRVLIKV